jgi:hypothetical protein
MKAQKKLGNYFTFLFYFFLLTQRFLFPAQKCREYTQQRLRAPPFSLVQQWGKKLKLNAQDIQTVSDSLPLRHALGEKKKFFFAHLF